MSLEVCGFLGHLSLSSLFPYEMDKSQTHSFNFFTRTHTQFSGSHPMTIRKSSDLPTYQGPERVKEEGAGKRQAPRSHTPHPSKESLNLSVQNSKQLFSFHLFSLLTAHRSHEGKGFCLFCSLLQSPHTRNRRLSTNTYWINGQMDGQILGQEV